MVYDLKELLERLKEFQQDFDENRITVDELDDILIYCEVRDVKLVEDEERW